MIGRLKGYALAAMSIISVIFYALFQKQRADAAQRKADQAIDSLARKVKASKAVTDGLERENKIRENTSDRGPGRFS